MTEQSCKDDVSCGDHCTEGLFYDLDALQDILDGEFYTVPPGLSREETRYWLLSSHE